MQDHERVTSIRNTPNDALSLSDEQKQKWMQCMEASGASPDLCLKYLRQSQWNPKSAMDSYFNELSNIKQEEPHVQNEMNETVQIRQKDLDALYYSVYSLENRLKSIEAKVAQNQIQNEQRMTEILRQLNRLTASQQQQQQQQQPKNDHPTMTNKKKKKNKMKKRKSPTTRSETQQPFLRNDDGSKWRVKPNRIHNQRMYCIC